MVGFKISVFNPKADRTPSQVDNALQQLYFVLDLLYVVFLSI